MSTNLQDRLLERSRPQELKRSVGLFGATTVGIGGLMGAGLYVLVGIAAAAAGPGLWIAYATCALLTTLSVLMFADLSRRMPVAGGGYIYAYRQLGSFWGFLVGWHLAVGSIFACALYAYGFGAYLVSLLPGGAPAWTTKAMASGIVVLLALLGLRGGKGGDALQRLFTWGNILVLLVLVAVAVPLFSGSRFEPMLPRGLGGVGVAVSLIYISFFGYQLVANNAEEVVDAERTVPRAMILAMVVATLCYMLVALAAVAAVDWRALASSEAPLVLVAEKGIGRWGAWLIGAGGILASVAALNSTLLSQGRQIFAMGRDRLLPAPMARLTESAKVPALATLAGGVVVLCAILFADLEFIAKAANFSLLVSMLPLSLALYRMQRDAPGGYRSLPGWRRAVPWAALAANLGLLLTLDAQSLFFGGTIVGAGALIFIGYSHASERRGQAGLSVDLTEEGRAAGRLRRGARVLVPMANPRTQQSLFAVSEALLPLEGGEVVALTVVLSQGAGEHREALRRASGTHDAIELLTRVSDMAESRGVTITPVVRAASSLAEGIAHAAHEEHCQLIVMGWAVRDDGTPSALLDQVVSQVHADVVFLQLSHDSPPKRVGVALGARSNLPLMVRVASALAEQYAGEVIYLNVLPEYYGQEHLRHARQVHSEALSRHQSLVPYRVELLRSDNPLDALVARSADLDLLVIGSAQAGPYASEAVGAFSAMVAAQAKCSVVIVRSAPTGRQFLPMRQGRLRKDDDSAGG